MECASYRSSAHQTCAAFPPSWKALGSTSGALLKHRKLVRDLVQFDLKPLHHSNEFGGGFLFFWVQFNHARSTSNFRGEVDGASLAADHAPRKGVNAAWTTNTFLPRFPL
jgi:hypothetical protein